MFEDGSKTHYNITEVKKRRGVSTAASQSGRSQLTSHSAPPLQADATAATGLTRPSGAGDLTVPERFAMPAGFITPSWNAKDSSSRGTSARSRKTGIDC